MSNFFSGGKTTNSVPKWIEDAGKNIYSKASAFYDKGYTPYKGNRVAAFNPTQTTAFAQIGNNANYDTADQQQAIDWTKDAHSMVPSIADVGRVVDENGALGKISDYVNPYTDAALDPAIRDINRAADAERGRIGDSAFGAHAFGDARQGLRENELARTTETAIGDTSAKAHEAAFNQAMTTRGTDLDRIIAGRTTAAGLGLQSANQLSGEAAAKDKSFLDRVMAQLGVGNLEQQNSQSKLDTNYQAWQGARQDQYDRLASLMSVIQGVPYTRTTQTSSNPMTDILKLFGSLAGSRA